jgi:hypothetical protein
MPQTESSHKSISSDKQPSLADPDRELKGRKRKRESTDMSSLTLPPKEDDGRGAENAVGA